MHNTDDLSVGSAVDCNSACTDETVASGCGGPNGLFSVYSAASVKPLGFSYDLEDPADTVAGQTLEMTVGSVSYGDGVPVTLAVDVYAMTATGSVPFPITAAVRGRRLRVCIGT